MISHEPKPSKEVQFTIPDFLKKYVDDADCCEDYIFEYKGRWDTTPPEYKYLTAMAEEYQIAPEALGVYFIYETPEGVKKHYKIDDFRDIFWEITELD